MKKKNSDLKGIKRDLKVYKALLAKKELVVFDVIVSMLMNNCNFGINSEKEIIDSLRIFADNLSEFKLLALAKNDELDKHIEGLTDEQRVEYFQLLSFCRKGGLIDFSLLDGDK